MAAMYSRIQPLTMIAWVLAITAALNGWLPTPHAAAAQGAGLQGVAERTLRLPETPYRYAEIALPAHFVQPAEQRFDNTPANNPITDHGATLGRVLFYDTRLSANHTISCGSCHVQKHAFVDPNRFSRGFEGKFT